MNAELSQWWLDVFHELEHSADANDLFSRVTGIAGQLGFLYCSYGIRFTAPSGPAGVTVLDSYPREWMAHYLRRNYVTVDPTVLLGTQSNGLVIWSDQVFADASLLWSEAQDFGLRVGMAQPAWGALGSYGLLSLARDQGELLPREIEHLRPRLRWLAETAHQRMQTLLSRRCGESAISLSHREHEVLSWTAEGKTSWEVSQILSISESTVNFHIRKLLLKLNAQNRIQAAVKATALGILASPHAESARAREVSDSDTAHSC